MYREIVMHSVIKINLTEFNNAFLFMEVPFKERNKTKLWKVKIRDKKSNLQNK